MPPKHNLWNGEDDSEASSDEVMPLLESCASPRKRQKLQQQKLSTSTKPAKEVVKSEPEDGKEAAISDDEAEAQKREAEILEAEKREETEHFENIFITAPFGGDSSQGSNSSANSSPSEMAPQKTAPTIKSKRRSTAAASAPPVEEPDITRHDQQEVDEVSAVFMELARHGGKKALENIERNLQSIDDEIHWHQAQIEKLMEKKEKQCKAKREVKELHQQASLVLETILEANVAI